MNIGVNCCHLSDKTDGAKTRLINFYSLTVKKKKKSKFIFFIPKNLNIKEFKKNFNSPNVSFHKINIHSYDVIKRFLLGIFFWPLLFKKYDLNYFDQSYLPLFTLFKGKTKIILTIHDLRYLYFSLDFFYRYIVFKPVVKIGIYFCDILITVSNHIKNDLKKITSKKIIVISNFIDNKKFSLKNKKIIRDKFIFSIGHSEKRKNLDNLIKAFMYIKLAGYKGYLVICTNQGTELKKLEKLKVDHPYSEYIRIFRNQDNQSVFEFYKHCELFVLPSLYEGFGIPILEAAFHKKLIILSSIPVFKEITFNKLNYFDPNNPKKISEKITNILKDKNKKKQMIEHTSKVNKYYSPKKIVSEFNKLFK